jgi:hypothetical protein
MPGFLIKKVGCYQVSIVKQTPPQNSVASTNKDLLGFSVL